MRKLAFRPRAIADIDEIWDYIARRWAVDQAERYVLAVRDACRALARGEQAGRGIDDIRPGYFKQAVGRHFVFPLP